MTGFGSSSIKNKDFQVFVSVKSINSRFMDIKCYTPSFYYPLESEIQKAIANKCTRGQFIVRVNRFPEGPQPGLILKWDKKQAKKWKNLYEALSKELKIKNNINTSNLINQTGVVNAIKTPVSLTAAESQRVKKIFNQAFNNCLKERAREGLALRKDIFRRMQFIENDLKKVKKINHSYYKSKSKKKNLESNGPDKTDTHEEIIRMAEHIKHFKNIAKKTSAVGKRLDFYVQEMLREINTIGSKSQASMLTRHVVEMKANLERVKEQVQNIE